MDQQSELTNELKKLSEKVDKLTNRYNIPNMFFGGMLRGMGLIVGATLLVLVGSTILSLLGFFPALSDVVQVIRESFEKARLQ